MKVQQLFDLTNRVALITGGSRGLGLQMAEALGELGAKLAITARKPAELDQALQHLHLQGIEAQAFVNDLSDHAGIPALVDEVVAALGPIDILVNNAGATWGARAEEHPLEAWHKVMNLNVTGMFVLSQEVGRRCMIARKQGRIINLASVLGFVGSDPRYLAALAYNTSKGAVVNFTRSLAAEWGPYGITVNGIAPGFFPTKMSKHSIKQGDAFLVDSLPLKRLGSDHDLKGVIALLASEAGAYITGQTIAVDGGYLAV